MDTSTIVHIIPSLHKGGAERFVVDLCNMLSTEHAGEVHLVSMYNNSFHDTFRKEIGPKVFYHELSKSPGFDAQTVFRLFKLLLRLKPAVIHTHINTFEYALPYRLFHSGASFFHTLHNDAFKECGSKFLRKLRKLCFRWSIATPVTISRESSRSFRTCYGQAGDIVIENGIFPLHARNQKKGIRKAYNLGNETKRYLLINVARIAEQKNQEMLIEAVRLLNEDDVSCLLLIIGDIQDTDLYQRLQRRKDENVHFTGAVGNVADYLAEADVFCLSSKYEGMPISLLEAMSAGCIPVCTPVGGIPEMIEPGVSGFISKDLSAQAYADAVKESLTASNRESIRMNCMREFCAKFHIRVSAIKHLNAYGV